MLDTPVIKNLRNLILEKVGLTLISPSDCKTISIAIQKELNKNISETTIKRLFGFAVSKTKFSTFTINALTEFVTESHKKGAVQSNIPFLVNDIQYITHQANRITSHSLQNIKSRCSVPYDCTIERKFATYDFHHFYSSNYSFTAFIAQPGYGKTILLSHLVEDVIIAKGSIYEKDVVCYFNASHIFDQENHLNSLEDNIKLQIGIDQQISLVDYFDEQYQKSKIKLILIFDGFADLVLNKNSKIKIFGQINDFIATINDSNSVKIILSMRSTTWNRFFERIRHAYFLKSKWFPGSFYYLDYNSNVPPLSEKELESVIEKMNPGNYEKITPILKSQLKFPFHIEWYYKLKEQYPAFSFYTNVIFYEIISLFIIEKIFKSNNATEKILICKRIVELTNYSRKGNKLVKADLIVDLSIDKDAYSELLSDGILMEEKHFLEGYPVEYVRFVYPHIFEYFLFIELLEVHKSMDKAFFEHIQEEYLGNQVRFQLLQWAARQLIITRKFTETANLFSLDLTNYEKNYLIYFIAENLNYQHIDHPELLNQIREQNLHKILIRELVHFDFVDSCYKDAIESLLEIVDNEENALFYNTILAIIDCLSFDQHKIFDRLKKIEPLKHDKADILVNPYEIVHLIYLKLTGVPVPATNETIVKVEALKQNKIEINQTGKRFPVSEDFIGTLLLILLNAFYGTRKDAITIINMILTSYPRLIKTKNSFSIYLLNVLAMSNAKLNPGPKTDQMERVITNLFENKTRNKPTIYAQSLLLILKAQQCKNKKDFEKAIFLIKEGLIIFNRNQLFMYELFLYNIIISIYTEMHDYDNADLYHYKKLQLLEEKKLSALFLEYIEYG